MLVALAGMAPLPRERVPVQGSVFPHAPAAARGSFGIQPFSSPSWYDHAGVSTAPETDELPIFQFQKNQFCCRTVLACNLSACGEHIANLEGIHAREGDLKHRSFVSIIPVLPVGPGRAAAYFGPSAVGVVAYETDA